MIGQITLWAGAVLDIPVDWQLCDGTNGTPDLRDRFVVGAGSTYAVDDTGGALVHDHAPGTTGTTPLASGATIWLGSDSAESSSLPPYYALAYIQHVN